MYSYARSQENDYSTTRGGKTINEVVNNTDPIWGKVKKVPIKVKKGSGFYKAIRDAGWKSEYEKDGVIVAKLKKDHSSKLNKDGTWKEDATIYLPSYNSYRKVVGGDNNKSSNKKSSSTTRSTKSSETQKKLSKHYNRTTNGASILEVKDSNSIIRNSSGTKQVDEEGNNRTIPQGTMVNIVEFGYYDDNKKMIALVQDAHTQKEIGWTAIENLETRSFMAPSDFRSQMGGDQPARITGKAGCRHGASDMMVTFMGKKEDNECWLNQTGLRDTKKGVEWDMKVGLNEYAENGNYFRLIEEDKWYRRETEQKKKFKKSEWLKDMNQRDMAVNYINKYLEVGVPLVAGVDHTYNTNRRSSSSRKSMPNEMGYNDGTTDHYITLNGMGKTTKGKRWYTFYDPRTQHVYKGTALKNILFENEHQRFECRNGGGGKNWYHLSLVVIFPNDREQHKWIINKNKQLFEDGKLIDPEK